MNCPLCEGEFEAIELRTIANRNVNAKHCTQCGGFWLERELAEPLMPDWVAQYDTPQPNYSLKASDLFCPIDDSRLEQIDGSISHSGTRFWQCNDCRGQFYPKGQLALLTNYLNVGRVKHPAVTTTRGRAAMGVSLVALLTVSVLASFNRFAYQLNAASNSPLPTTGPSVYTLILLALAYVAGTVLAVLGRKLPIIFTGWAVIAVCMVGFAVVIFGP